MLLSSKWLRALLFVFMVLVALIACKPEDIPAAEPKTGMLVSPTSTTMPTLISPLPTPVLTPWPPDSTPSPDPALSPTPGSLLGPQTLYDSVSHFSLTLYSGWYASAPDPHVANVIDIANYNFYTTSRPLDGISIQVQAGPLPSDKSFEQWLADYRVRETSPDNGAFGVVLTDPQPYQLGRYEGVSYIATGQEGERVLVIHILSGDGWIAVISLNPYDASNPPSTVLSDALSMLATIQISSQPLR